ncbi:hypothetical protein CPT_Moabite_052 [Serratia phage Moabite]|uniref:Uncharacterized protein n=3 Tax=Moabitevirus TaxID=2843422 RepID=A0A7T3NC12_9CAUD|nr:hypothetical protein HWB23_gp325 [Serratia phage vB_SmaM_ 2050HW]YP_009849148.1 hypothetical protein HWC48_gp052 [Serratia phage Moabite]QPX76764.1 hypothetical protein [Serratia phage vB_SmaM_Yaphecito]UCR74593.1 hypothetical protein [Serratia phage BUCT660]UGO54269.1 hypothetical protein HAYMO_287 [Serratia phage vB_SmaM_Haymo]UQT03774.1 hypothetical protein KODAMA_03070 [Serratia phage vB_SmaM-Kodama]URG14161.1 hypothetical protein [Pectobacterium phage vB_ParM-25]
MSGCKEVSGIVKEAVLLYGEVLELSLWRQVQVAKEKSIDDETIAAVLDISVEEVQQYSNSTEAEVVRWF